MCTMTRHTQAPSMNSTYIEILQLIPRDRQISTTDLYERMKEGGLNVSRRSFERYMEDICEKFEIERNTTSRPYGYRWKKNSNRLSLGSLNAQEAMLLLLAEQQLHKLLPASLKSSLSPFFEQAKRVLEYAHLQGAPGGKLREAREWLNKVRVLATTVPVLPPQLADGVFEAVSEALLHNHMLNIDYRNAKGELKVNKRIKPLGLAQAEERLFLVCQFDGYDEPRNLAMQRILSAVDTRMPFDRPPNFDLKAYEAEGQFSYGKGEPIQLTMWVSSYLSLLMTETPLSEDQTLSPMPEPPPWAGDQSREGSLLQATVVHSHLLERWLRSQGKGLRVLGPAGLLARL